MVIASSDPTWLTPAATLAAVFIGGLLATGGQFWLARQNENGEAKAAARVVQGDLAIAASRLKDMTSDQRWYGFYTLALPHWSERQAILARKLEVGDWERVSQSALELDGFQDGMIKAMAPGGPQAGAHDIPLSSPTQQQGIGEMRKNATAAYNSLCGLAGTEPVRGLLHP